MWQRKQTVFLLLAVVAVIGCLLMPVGGLTPPTLGPEARLTCLGWTGTAVEGHAPAFPLAIAASLVGIIAIAAIVLYRDMKLQMRLCSWAMALCVLWYVYYAFVWYSWAAEGTMHVRFASCLPLVACILLWMARRGVRHDYDLVRSADRIR